MEKFNNKYKKPIWLGISMLLFMALLIFLAFGSKDIKRSTESTSKKRISYVLVNQDEGTDFNGKHYNLGEDFKSLINQDTEHQWQTASLSVAEAGYKEGAYDAQIVLPQNFSKRILSLEDVNPEQANITYKVQSGQNEAINQATQQKIAEILNTFNQKVIQMYFSSILSNFADAQKNVSSIVLGQSTNQVQLSNEILEPFRMIPSNYSSLVDGSKSLKEQNENWEKQQGEFSKDAQKRLDETATSIKKQTNDLTEYKKLQEEITKTNNKNAQSAIDYQQHKDLLAYRTMYDRFNDSVNEHLGYFDKKDAENGETGALADLKKNGELFFDSQTERIKEIKEEISALNQQAEDLVTLQRNIALKYYASEDKTPETATEEDVKEAILNLMAEEKKNEPKLLPLYLDTINQAISKLSMEDLKKILTVLHEDKVLSDNQFKNYQDAMEIIQKYVTDEHLSFGGQQSFEYLEAKNDKVPDDANFVQKIALQLKWQEENIFELKQEEKENSGVLSIAEADKLKAEIEKQLIAKLNSVGFTGKPIVKIEPLTISISFEEVRPGNPNELNGNSSGNQGSNGNQNIIFPTIEGLEKEFNNKVNMDVTLNWKFSEKEKENQVNEISYNLINKNSKAIEYSGKITPFFDFGKKNDALSKDFSVLTEHLDNLNQIVGQIIFIFGNPENQELNIPQFNAKWKQNPETTLKDQAADGSIYRSYDNISSDEKKDLISSSLAQLFKQQGDELYQSVEKQKDALQGTIGENGFSTGEGANIAKTLEDMIDPKFVNEEVEKLEKWFDRAQRAVEETYNRWEENPAIELNIAPYSSKKDHQKAEVQPIYYEDSIGGQLYDEFKVMESTSADHATTTKAQAASILSMNNQFDGLFKGTDGLKKNVENILNDLNQFVDKNSEEVNENKEYDDRFSKVLSNTHKGGADNKNVFNFLSNPLRSTGEKGTVVETSVVPYFMTIVNFLLIAAASYLFGFFNSKRKLKATAKLLKPSRIWMNTPMSLKLIAGSIVVAGIFSGVATAIIQVEQPLPWAGYTFLVIVGGILIFTALWRWIGRPTVYVLGSLAAIYLLMSPIIGMTIVKSSAVGWIFKLSPLQNVENGYTAMIAGGSIGWESVTFLVIIIVLGIILNLFVKNSVKEAVLHEA